jgi:hypothetical protein
MRFRKLRITWSVGCAIACVLLIVLWVRSYSWSDDLCIRLPNSQRQFIIHSILGGTLWYSNNYPPWKPVWTHKYWRIESDAVAVLLKDLEVSRTDSLTRIELFSAPSLPSFSRHVALPHWVFVATFATFAAAPWVRQIGWQFSLRTLLVATTLVALVLGLIVWLSH